MNALSGQAIRILKLFGKDVDYVSTTVGPEQEYFLVKKEDYEARQDLILTGRTLFALPLPRVRSWRSITSVSSVPRSPNL